MHTALRDFLEVELPCEELARAGTSDDDALGAADNCVEFLVPHTWPEVVRGQCCREDVDLFLRALLRFSVAWSCFWPSSTAPPHCEVLIVSLAAPCVLTLSIVLIAQLGEVIKVD